MSTGGAATLASTALAAAARGLVDIDSDDALATFHAQLELLKGAIPIGVEGWEITPSQSRRPGHVHITVRLRRAVTRLEALLLQAVLGSDLKRELLGFGRHLEGAEVVTAFFERPEDDAVRRLRSGIREEAHDEGVFGP